MNIRYANEKDLKNISQYDKHIKYDELEQSIKRERIIFIKYLTSS